MTHQSCATRFPCHIYEIQDGKEAFSSSHFRTVKEYGDHVAFSDGSTLHWNHEWDDGERRLICCRDCGGLFIVQSSEFHSFSDLPDGYYTDWIPVESVEVADLMNILMDGMDLEQYPNRHLRANDLHYFWTKGKDPEPTDPDLLKHLIRKKYAEKNAEEIEKLIQSAGEGCL